MMWRPKIRDKGGGCGGDMERWPLGVEPSRTGATRPARLSKLCRRRKQLKPQASFTSMEPRKLAAGVSDHGLDRVIKFTMVQPHF